MNIALDARLHNNEAPAQKEGLADKRSRPALAADYRSGQEALSPANRPNYEMQAEALRPKPADAAPAPVELSEQEYHALQAQLARLEAEGHTLERVYRGPDGTLHLRAKRAPDPNRPGMSEQKGPAIPYRPGLMTEAEFVACAKASHSLGGSLVVSGRKGVGYSMDHASVCRDAKLGQAGEGAVRIAAQMQHGAAHGPHRNQTQGELALEGLEKNRLTPIPTP